MDQKQLAINFDIPLAEQLRDEGIQRAVDHADRVELEWSEMAFIGLNLFLAENPGIEFMAEDLRYFLLERNLSEPPDNRAIASVIMRAARGGLIHKVSIGQAKDPKCHRGYCSVWKKL